MGDMLWPFLAVSHGGGDRKIELSIYIQYDIRRLKHIYHTRLIWEVAKKLFAYVNEIG